MATIVIPHSTVGRIFINDMRLASQLVSDLIKRGAFETPCPTFDISTPTVSKVADVSPPCDFATSTPIQSPSSRVTPIKSASARSTSIKSDMGKPAVSTLDLEKPASTKAGLKKPAATKCSKKTTPIMLQNRFEALSAEVDPPNSDPHMDCKDSSIQGEIIKTSAESVRCGSNERASDPHMDCKDSSIQGESVKMSAESVWCGSKERAVCDADGLKNCLCCGLRCIPSDVPNAYCLDCEDMIDEALHSEALHSEACG